MSRWRLLGIMWATGAALCGPAAAQDQVTPTAVAPIVDGAAAVPVKPVWPRRIAAPGHNGDMGVIRPVDAPDGLAGYQPSPFRQLSAEDKADAAAIAGDRPVQFEQPGSFAFGIGKPRPASAKPALKRAIAGAYFKFISARELPGAPRNGPAEPALHVQRTWFAYYDSTREGDGPRGIALVMPGLFNTPEPVIEYVIGKLRGRGWAVLRMMAQPSRFTERTPFAIDPDHLDACGARIAAEMQDRAAECAFAAQAAFDHVLGQHPELAKLPRIALGMSGGAMTLPTVLAREPEKYAAAVMVAGGADFYQIAVESNYRHLVEAISFEWPTPPTVAQAEQLDREYLLHGTLDSYHTAPLLAGKPLLMIHGTHDGAVPAHLGDLLWERLGKPERWPEESGHEEVFAHLPKNTDRILDWLDAKIGAPPPEKTPASP